MTELPELNRGKGNKLIGVKAPDKVVGMTLVAVGGVIRLNSGKRHLSCKWSDIEGYIGTRAQRGKKLPRGFQQVQSIETVK